jgi:hypothetical protein
VPAKISHHRVRLIIVEAGLFLVGAALIFAAFAATREWGERHFLPSFFETSSGGDWIAPKRVGLAAVGLFVALLVRPRVGRLVARTPAPLLTAGAARAALALLLALFASELYLERHQQRAAEERPPDEEPRRERDPVYGWHFVPARVGRAVVAGRRIEYAFDAGGHRVRRPEEAPDPARPTILLAGESSMVGHGLAWDETIAAQLQARTGTQVANLAVHGFASDQAYRRLADELPRFAHPVALVTLFMPSLFDRNLNEDRPHLGPDLKPLPAVRRWRLAELLAQLVPYRSSAAIERGIATTRAVLRATVELGRARGCQSLILVPQFGPERPMERTLRRRILDEPGLPYLLVPLDPSWRLHWDLHPDARAARAMADALVAALAPATR